MSRSNFLMCEECNWMGEERDCKVVYKPDMSGEPEATLVCPKCGSEGLSELIGQGADLEPVPA